MLNLAPDPEMTVLFNASKASTKADFTDFSSVFAFARTDSYNDLDDLKMMALFKSAKNSILAGIIKYPNVVIFFRKPRTKRLGKRRRNKYGW